MAHYLTLSRHQAVAFHDLTEEHLASHPNTLGRILYFALPYLFALIVNLTLAFRNLRVHQNNFIRPFPPNSYFFIAFAVCYIGAAIAGIYAVISDAWTVKEWLLFAIFCIFIGLKGLIFTVDSNPTLLITCFLMIIASILNEWLFIELRDMAEGSQNELAWKHTVRNFVGFIQAVVIIYTFLFLTESLVSVFKTSHRCADYFFWILAPIATILVLVWNILSFGPFLDQIGYIVAALFVFLGAAVSTLFHK